MGEGTVIENTSTTKVIEISLGQTEGRSIAIPDGKTIINPLEKITIPKSFDCGCAKMFVWDKSSSKDMLWCGIVPLCGKTPIKIDPDTKKVSVLDGDIPTCEEALVSETKPKIKENFAGQMEKEEISMWFWILLFLIVGILLFILK